MFDNNDTDFILCPDSFRFNCASYEVRCHECGGCTGEGELHYVPIQKTKELATKNHPYLINRKKVKKEAARKEKRDKRATETSRVVKKALKSEKKSLQSIGAKSTIASGRFDGSGDGFIEINGTNYYIEVKTRYSDNVSQFPTSSEWKKAKDQGCRLFIVESTKGSTVTMSKETFMEMLGI